MKTLGTIAIFACGALALASADTADAGKTYPIVARGKGYRTAVTGSVNRTATIGRGYQIAMRRLAKKLPTSVSLPKTGVLCVQHAEFLGAMALLNGSLSGSPMTLEAVVAGRLKHIQISAPYQAGPLQIIKGALGIGSRRRLVDYACMTVTGR